MKKWIIKEKFDTTQIPIKNNQIVYYGENSIYYFEKCIDNAYFFPSKNAARKMVTRIQKEMKKNNHTLFV